MKNRILLLLSIATLLACSSKNNYKKEKNLGLKKYTAYYNTLFNGQEALKAEIDGRKKSHQDNFYQPYIKILKEEDQPIGSNFDVSNSFFSDDDDPSSALGRRNPANQAGRQLARPGFISQQNAGTSVLDIAAAKAQKTITKYSVIKNGREKNKTIFDAYITLAQVRLLQDRPLEALDALNNIFTTMPEDKRIGLAKVYQAQAYTKLGDYFRADEIFRSLNGMPRSYDKLKTIYYSEMLLSAGKKEAAINELENAFTANKNRYLRSRIAFLRGQVLTDLNRNEDARESFATAYKYSNDFQFEVRSQVEIAKTFRGKEDDYESAKNYLEKISKKGTYASRKNEFYYALGLMANEAGKPEDAQNFFRLALREELSDPQLRGLTYYEIGRAYLSESDYIAAGAYYDSAVAVMTYQPQKAQLELQSQNIKDITKNYYLVKRNDSILNLVQMPENERNAFFAKHIDEIRKKEMREDEEAAKLAQQRERTKGFDTGDYDTNAAMNSAPRGFQDFSAGGSRGGFYFANQGTVARGQADFKQIWGSRSAQDNWRYSSRNRTLEDAKNESMGIASVRDPRRYEVEFYTENLPKNPEEIASLKKARDTASLGLGRMYNAYFGNRPLATETLYSLADAKPEDEVRLQALYQIFAMNYEQNPQAAERAKQIILSDYPYTSYAEFVKNPKNTDFTQSSKEVVKAYTDAFSLYEDGKYEESMSLISKSLEQYPKDALVPKFALLNAYNTGKTAGKEIMILQLEQLALNYAKTPEGMKAAEMLNYLQSDLQMEMTDESGNRIPAAEKAAPQARAENPLDGDDPAGIERESVPTSRVRLEEANRPIPEINTTQDVVQPMQNSELPTSPVMRRNQERPPLRTPGMRKNDGFGNPAQDVESMRKSAER